MAGNIWVISDTHFNHNSMLTFKDKDGNLVRSQFTDVNHMNECMIDNWNSVVKPGDKIYHLGDVFMGDREWFQRNWPKLNGSKRLIVGNHDDIKYMATGGFFQKIQMWRLFSEFGLMLSHVPLEQGSLKIYGSKDKGLLSVPIQLLNIHGHIHQNASPPGPYRNVSVEVINYTPVNIEELRIW